MAREEYFWVVQIVGGQRLFNGPYLHRDSAENRASRIHGGEIHVFRSWSNTAEQAENEFVGEIANG